MTDFQRLTILAHMYANAILKEFNGTYRRAYSIGMQKAKRKLKIF
jgi:hypothetical protein